MALTKLNNQSLTAVTSAGLPSGTVLQVVTGTDEDQGEVVGAAGAQHARVQGQVPHRSTALGQKNRPLQTETTRGRWCGEPVREAAR